MTKFCKSGKTGPSDFLFRLSGFDRFREGSWQKLNLKIQECFEAWKIIKKCQGAKIEEIQAQRRGHKNRTIRFGIPEYPVFSEQIEFNLDLRFSLFRKDFLVSDSKSYVLIPI
jgi:hypothetical protein